MSNIEKEPRINEEIKEKEIRVIDSDGKAIGIVCVEEALKLAESKELDLVEVSPKAVPPVCKIMDYDKYRYEMEKKEKVIHKKQKSAILKEIWLKPQISSHDLDVKINNIKKFLTKKNKVRIVIKFHGRETSYSENVEQILKKLSEEVSSLANQEGKPKRESKRIIITLLPK